MNLSVFFLIILLMIVCSSFIFFVQAHGANHHHHHHHHRQPSKFDREPEHVRKAHQQSSVVDPFGGNDSNDNNDLFDGINTKCPYSDPDFAKRLEGDLYEKMPRVLNPPAPGGAAKSKYENNRAADNEIAKNTASDASFENIRITASFEDLSSANSNNYCTAAGQVRSDYAGSTVTCETSQILTAAKKDLLQNTIIPYAIARIERALRVQRFDTPLQPPSTSSCAGGFTIPSNYVTTGAPNTDYLLVVAGQPVEGGVIAYAATCLFTNDEPLPRAALGRANFNPKFLDLTQSSLQSMLRTGLHEILHALYFSFNYMNFAGLISEVNINGATRRGITSPFALQTARFFYGCESLIAIPLENEGGSGTANSHVERKFAKDTLMAGSGGVVFSPIELAVARDMSNVYRVNFDEADPMYFGRGAGCEFAQGSSCPTTVSGSGEVQRAMFCNSFSPSPSCTSSLTGYGPCSTTFLIDSCQAFSPFSDAQCQITTQGNITSLGESFHQDARCWDTTGNFKLTGASGVSFTQRCIQTRCTLQTPGGTTTKSPTNSYTRDFKLELRVGAQTTWYECTTANQLLTISGYDGQVKCPASLREMCASYLTTGKPIDEVDQVLKKDLAEIDASIPQNTQWSVYPGTTIAPLGGGGGSAGSLVTTSIVFVIALVVSLF